MDIMIFRCANQTRLGSVLLKEKTFKRFVSSEKASGCSCSNKFLACRVSSWADGKLENALELSSSRQLLN